MLYVLIDKRMQVLEKYNRKTQMIEKKGFDSYKKNIKETHMRIKSKEEMAIKKSNQDYTSYQMERNASHIGKNTYFLTLIDPFNIIIVSYLTIIILKIKF
jgi:hypothetical protein